ncbi:PREDICTED: MLO-like protein 8 [Tarenaya hassleriana]|uniref:MLO-like protein 8 n=1 Tax=Tarenaya hassleriana TaxID=28532 RepID=UPI00053C7D68|nr:PREDICTED: MLO-like protein 8 [Tarenaya hassleriana]XP_010530987.1 PREDICTED: MLO-like protein 8 [Tarenaya hassleriana]
MGSVRSSLLICLNLWWLLAGETVFAAEEKSGDKQRELSQTPTWAVSAVCTFFIAVSVLLEKFLHKLGTVLWERHKKALLDALEKVKSELMVLGFISLLLTFGQSYILKICIPEKAARTMLPCPASPGNSEHENEDSHRKLLWFDHRFLSEDGGSAKKCLEAHKQQLISAEALHQLHILIFFLAVFHVLYSFLTMMLGRLKIRGWKHWEQEVSSHDYEFSTDPSRFRLTHETSFVRAHTSFWTRIPFFFYVGCFFRQFVRSVGKTDYLTLRNGFIAVHLGPGRQFNFQKYIKRSLEDDFKMVVGVSPVLWASFVIYLLLNVHGWNTLYIGSVVPVIIILAVGTKLQAILTKMALEITDRHAVVQGMPLVQGSDRYFWFGHPQLLLHLIHFALFQNAFQITYFFWIWYSFGSNSCYHPNFKVAILKVSIGLAGLCLCSYITLPLYALVTQMGSRMKKSVFDEQTSKALKKWRMAVKKKQGKGGKIQSRRLGDGSASPTGSTIRSSSGRTLHRYKTTGHSTRSSTYDDRDNETSEFETDTEPLSPKPTGFDLVVRVDHRKQEPEATETHSDGEAIDEKDFSFAKPAPSKGSQ